MSLRDVLAYVQQQQQTGARVTPVTPENSTGLQPQPAWMLAVPPVTPVTPRFDNAQVNAPKPADCRPAPAALVPVPPPAPAAAPEPTDWNELHSAYMRHHFGCAVCKAAGRGVRYGLRCGVGAALWVVYDAAARAHQWPWEARRG